jgi:hypothetical protein
MRAVLGIVVRMLGMGFRVGLGVMLGGMLLVLYSVQNMAVGDVRVMRGLVVVARHMGLMGLGMMMSGRTEMLRRLLVMLVCAHIVPPK